MNFDSIFQELKQGADILRSMLEGVSQADAQAHPDVDAWSMLEVICHLYDEEREDFRARVDFILHQRQGNFPPIDPVGWVAARHYNEQDLQLKLQGFLAERQNSLEWLQSLREPNWDLGVQARYGLLRAGDIFTSWAAHDKLHIRQLVELRYRLGQVLAQPYDTRYAGEW
jgi:hypothetical protein